MLDKTACEANEQEIASIEQILSENLGNESYWQSRLENALETRQLYADTELKERPKLDYGCWLIIFHDDADMIDFLDTEIEECELPPNEADDLYEGVAIEYVLMTGVELGQLEKFEM